MGSLVSSLAFPVPPKEWAQDALLNRPDLVYLNTEQEDRIAAVHIRRGAGRTILYSHGNAEDLGLSLPYLDRMADVCAADIFAYDYCGYGISQGTPSEENCYLAIDAAYEHLRREVDPGRIIAFGRSIGSGPTVDLVSRHPEIRAMVLQSPLESGGRAIFGKGVAWVAYRMDIFRNYEKMDKIQQPVFIMHGTADQVVPFSNGKAIHEMCANPAPPFWVPERGHNDMPDHACLQKVHEFLNNLDYTQPTSSSYRSVGAAVSSSGATSARPGWD